MCHKTLKYSRFNFKSKLVGMEIVTEAEESATSLETKSRPYANVEA